MTAAPTPPPHVPVSFLLAGGSAVFSADCVQAFIDCNINPNWIGSYGALVARKEAASRVVAQHTALVRAGVPSPHPPTFEERWLSASTAGHLARDANHRDYPSARGDNCATNVDGYTERGAPAMMTMGSSTTPGTVEHDVSQRENAQAAARAEAHGVGGPYPRGERQADQREVVNTAVNSHQNLFPQGLHNTPATDDPSVHPSARRRVAQERADAIAAAGRDPTAALGDTSRAPVPAAAPGEATVPLVDNANKAASPEEQAAECLAAYCDAIEQPAARVAAIDQEIARQQAQPAPTAAQQAAHQQEQARLDQAAHDRAGEATTATANRTAADAEFNRHANTPRDPRADDRTQRRLDNNATARHDEAARAEQNANQASAEAQRAADTHRNSTPAAQVACLQTQRANILAGAPRDRGTVPPPQ